MVRRRREAGSLTASAHLAPAPAGRDPAGGRDLERHRLSASLAEFMDGHPYSVETLRHDLARFRSLLSARDPDRDF
jgi:hypothetical protein